MVEQCKHLCCHTITHGLIYTTVATFCNPSYYYLFICLCTSCSATLIILQIIVAQSLPSCVDGFQACHSQKL